MRKFLFLLLLFLVSCTKNQHRKEEALVLNFLEEFQKVPLDPSMRDLLNQKDLYKMLEVSPRAKAYYLKTIQDATFEVLDVTDDYSDHLVTVTLRMEVADARKTIAALYLNDAIRDFTAFDFHNLFSGYGYDEYVETLYQEEEIHFMNMAEKNMVKNQLYRDLKKQMAENIKKYQEQEMEKIKYRLEFIVDQKDGYIVSNYSSLYDFRPALGFYLDENEIIPEFLEYGKEDQ